MDKFRSIIRKGEGEHIVLDFRPKEFPIIITQAAENFVSSQRGQGSDFKISDLVAGQVGINKLEKQSIEDRIEEMALTRLKEVEEKAYGEAYELGMIEGSSKAFDESKQEISLRLSQLDQLLKYFDNIKAKLLVENEAVFMKIIFSLAKKIALKEINENQDAILSLLQQVVEETQTDDTITVKISPEDFDYLEGLREKSNQKLDFLKRLKLESSDEITSGGCFALTNFGSIDATVEQRVQKAWETIEAKLPRYKEKKAEDQVPVDPPESDSDNTDEGDGEQ